jgi:acetyl esterase/lipase
LAAVVVAAFKFTPWPSVAIISYMFSKGDQVSDAGLAKYVPGGLVTRTNLAYGSGPDETFDISVPAGTKGPLPTIVWVHGGGWIGGSTKGIANYLKILASHGYTTVGVEYSTGYGTTYPKPVEQVNAALGYLVRQAIDLHIDPAAIFLAGDSAGAQIAAQVALITTDPAYAGKVGIAPTLKPEQLSAMLLLSGAYDLEAVDYHGDYAWFLKTLLWAYSGMENFLGDQRFRLMSITPHVTAAFPPSFISSGNGDPLAPQGVALARKLAHLGVRVDTLFFPADRKPALPHEYQFNMDNIAGQEALKNMLSFLATVRKAKAGVSATGR